MWRKSRVTSASPTPHSRRSGSVAQWDIVEITWLNAVHNYYNLINWRRDRLSVICQSSSVNSATLGREMRARPGWTTGYGDHAVVLTGGPGPAGEPSRPRPRAPAGVLRRLSTRAPNWSTACIAPANRARRVCWNGAPTSIVLSWIASSRASTNAGCMSATRTARTTTDTLIEPQIDSQVGPRT